MFVCEQLFQEAAKVIAQMLDDGFNKPEVIKCADGMYSKVRPMVAAWLGDLEEQGVISLIRVSL